MNFTLIDYEKLDRLTDIKGGITHCVPSKLVGRQACVCVELKPLLVKNSSVGLQTAAPDNVGAAIVAHMAHSGHL